MLWNVLRRWAWLRDRECGEVQAGEWTAGAGHEAAGFNQLSS